MATKPRLAFYSNNRPLPLDDNASIVKKITTELYVDKAELTGYIDTLYDHPQSDSYLYVECDCGVTYDYADSAAVPASDVVCTCGRNVINYSGS